MFRFRKFLPLLNRVLIEKAQPVTKSKFGILLPEKDTITNYGKVVAIGPGTTHEGYHTPVNVKVGQTVVLPDYGGNTIKLVDNKEYMIFKDDDLLGVLEDEEK